MDNLQPQSSPRLNLTDIQKTILQAHISDAIAQMLQLTFVKPENWNAEIVQFAFQRGRMNLVTDLLEYDAEMATQARAE